MAFYKGANASIKKASVVLAGVKNWTMDSTMDTEEVTAMQDGAKKHTAKIYEWGGGFEAHGDPENTEHGALRTAHQAGTELTDCEFFIDATHKISGNIIITGWSPATDVNGILVESFTYKGSGTYTYA